MPFHADDMPDVTPVVTMDAQELHQPSGIVDTIHMPDGRQTDIELNNLQAAELLEVAVHGAQGVFLGDTDAQGKVTVYSARPSELQAKERTKLLADLGIDEASREKHYSWQPNTFV